MKFSVGYQQRTDWIDTLVERASSIYDVYFSYGAMPSGRAAVADVDRQLDDLGRLADAGISLGILFNANCYGDRALAKSFFSAIGDTIARFAESGALKSVTTTSPLIAQFVKDNFNELKTRASVNMEIGTELGMDYLADVFDGFYLKRELNRDIETVRRISDWCAERGKQLFLLANSGCLNFCSTTTSWRTRPVWRRRTMAMFSAGPAGSGSPIPRTESGGWTARTGSRRKTSAATRDFARP